MDKRFISEVHPPIPVVLIYASESGSQGFGVPVMTAVRYILNHVCSPFSVKKSNGMRGGLEVRGSAKVKRTSFVMALRHNRKELWSVRLDFAVRWLTFRHTVSRPSGRQMLGVSVLPPLDTRRTAPRYVPSFLRPAGPLLPGVLQERTAAELCA